MQITDVKSKSESVTGCERYTGRGSMPSTAPKMLSPLSDTVGPFHVTAFLSVTVQLLSIPPNASFTLVEMGVQWDKDVVLNTIVFL